RIKVVLEKHNKAVKISCRRLESVIKFECPVQTYHPAQPTSHSVGFSILRVERGCSSLLVPKICLHVQTNLANPPNNVLRQKSIVSWLEGGHGPSLFHLLASSKHEQGLEGLLCWLLASLSPSLQLTVVFALH